jgi:antitoxin (DNA-binding transcriptional repressor) of toxin-antitoxin stability system
VLVTHYGRPVARLLPILSEPAPEKESAKVWAELDQLAAEIGARWPEGVSATEAVAEGRREL